MPKAHDQGDTEASMRARARQKQAQTNQLLKKQGQTISPKDYQELKYSNPSAFNNRAEEKFVETVRRLVEEHGGSFPVWEVEREASYECKISTETVKRYLFKHSAMRAEFRVFSKQVFLNPNYRPEADPTDVDEDDTPADGEDDE